MRTYAKSIAWVATLIKNQFGVEVMPYICSGYVGIRLPILSEERYLEIRDVVNRYVAELPTGFIITRPRAK